MSLFQHWKPTVLYYLPLKHTVEYDSSQNDRGLDKYEHTYGIVVVVVESFSSKHICENETISCMVVFKMWAKLKNIYRSLNY